MDARGCNAVVDGHLKTSRVFTLENEKVAERIGIRFEIDEDENVDLEGEHSEKYISNPYISAAFDRAKVIYASKVLMKYLFAAGE